MERVKVWSLFRLGDSTALDPEREGRLIIAADIQSFKQYGFVIAAPADL